MFRQKILLYMKYFMHNFSKFLKFFWRWTYILLTPVLSFLVFRVILYLLFGFPIIITECILINIVVTSGISFKFAEYSKEYHSKLLFYRHGKSYRLVDRFLYHDYQSSTRPIGTPISGALLTKDFIWWRPIIFNGVYFLI